MKNEHCGIGRVLESIPYVHILKNSVSTYS